MKRVKIIWDLLMRVFRRIVFSLTSLLHIPMSEKQWEIIQQFILFAMVGVSNTVVLLICYYLVLFTAGAEHYLLGQTLGYIAGILNSFFWNSRYVFSEKKHHAKIAFLKMCICYGLTYFLQIGILYGSVEWLSISESIAPVIAIIITTPINYVLNKLFAFAG